jgi:hypothetical protein
MVRAFEFQPRRAFSPYCAMVIGRLGVFNFAFVAEVSSSPFLCISQYGNVVGTCKCAIFYIGDPIYFCWEGRISPIF